MTRTRPLLAALLALPVLLAGCSGTSGADADGAGAYDFARLPATAIGLDRAREAQLGRETLNEDFEPPADTRTFFERNPNVVNGLLVLAAFVAAVGGLLALRRRA